MWQSIPRTGSLLLRASRPHSIQRFTRCLLSSLHALLPALSGFPAVPLSSLHASLPKRPAVYPLSLFPPSMPRPLHPAFPPLPPLSSLHATLPASSGLPAASSPPSMPRSLRPAVYPLSLSSPSMPLSLRPAFTRCPSLPPTPCHPH